MTITIYTSQACPACEATKAAMKRRGKTYTEVEVTDELRDWLKGRGHSSLPVVITDTDEWHGVDPRRIRSL